LIWASGRNGSWYADSNTELIGSDGSPGGNGGNITVHCDPACLKYMGNVIKVEAIGGNGGRGAKGIREYGRKGRDGKDGKVTIINSKTNQTVSTSSSGSSSNSSSQTVQPVVKKEIEDGPFIRESNGITTLEGQYKNGMKTGTWTTYTDEGNVKEEIDYLEDKYHGDYIKYDGEFIRSIREYKNGKLDGLQTYFHLESEQIDYKEHRIDGKKEGDYIMYWKDGKVRKKGKYVKNKKDGEWMSYTPQGKEIKTTYQAGVKQ